VGIFQYQKNLPSLLKVVKNLKEIKFKIAGSDGNNMDGDTKEALKDLKECGNVEFVGYLKKSEIIPFLSKAYALLNTSHYEGFSNTFLESFLAGTPVITTNEVDPDNIVRDNNLGRVAGNHGSLSGQITSLMKSDEYNYIAKKCRRYVLEKHAPELSAKRFIESLVGFSS
jgi:glycosyltransferase involved in cell wall biosynthesis